MGWRKSHEPADTGLAALRAPDYSEPLHAWRLWEVEKVDAGPRLRSLYRNCIWPVRAPFEARCEAQRLRLRRRSRHIAPAETCTCGVHAVPFWFIRALGRQDRLLLPGRSLVIGTVALWGDILECEQGWRASHAYPSRLFMPSSCPGSAEQVEGLGDYGVPVELLDMRCGVVDALDELEELVA